MARPGGRLVAWDEYGDRDGRAVFAFHGTPSSRLSMSVLHEAARDQGLRVIAVDRPGIGRSGPMPGFTLLDWPAEVSLVADALGIEAYAVLGSSGGGPYALACGVVPDPRLVLVATASSVAPYDRPEATQGVSRSDRITEILAERAPRASRGLMRAVGWSVRHTPRVAWRAWELELTPSDRLALERYPLVRRLAPLAESQRAGTAGTVQDYRLLAGPWGFLPEEVSVSTVLWHGADDPTVPLHHAQDLKARIPQSELFVVPGAGHLLVASHPEDLMGGIAARWRQPEREERHEPHRDSTPPTASPPTAHGTEPPAANGPRSATEPQPLITPAARNSAMRVSS